MYEYFLFISFLQQFRPYFRKHISNSLDHHEYLLLNSLCVFFISILYLLYLYSIRKIKLSKMVENYSSLTLTEFGCIITLSILTIIYAIFMFEVDKHHNSPLINSLFMKSAGAIALLCVGIFIFEESYKIHQIMGIGLILFGVYLVSSNKIQFL